MSESGEPVTRETPEPNRNQLAALRREVRQIRAALLLAASIVLAEDVVRLARWLF